MNIIVNTSPQPHVNSSNTTARLAEELAKAGSKVGIVDLSGNRLISNRYGLGSHAGISILDVLRDRQDIRNCWVEVDPNLYVAPGHLDLPVFCESNTGPFLGYRVFGLHGEKLAGLDIVLVDAPFSNSREAHIAYSLSSSVLISLDVAHFTRMKLNQVLSEMDWAVRMGNMNLKLLAIAAHENRMPPYIEAPFYPSWENLKLAFLDSFLYIGPESPIVHSSYHHRYGENVSGVYEALYTPEATFSKWAADILDRIEQQSFLNLATWPERMVLSKTIEYVPNITCNLDELFGGR